MGYTRTKDEYTHRYIYRQHFGEIPKGWVVHHKDENKSNNDPSNLVAMPKSEHQRLHVKGRPGSDIQKQAAVRTLESLRTPKQGKCLECGSEFVSRSANKVGKFCSLICTDKWRDNRFKPEQRNCLVCNTEYTAVKRFQRYCCKQCNAKSKVRTYRTQANGGTPRRTLAQLADIQPDS